MITTSTAAPRGWQAIDTSTTATAPRPTGALPRVSQVADAEQRRAADHAAARLAMAAAQARWARQQEVERITAGH